MSKHLSPPKKRRAARSQRAMKKAAEAADTAERFARRREMPEGVFSIRTVLPVAAALVIFGLSLALKAEGVLRLFSFLLPALIAGAPVLLRTGAKALRLEFTEGDVLIILAAAGAFALGEHVAGAAAVLLYRVAELLEAFLLDREKRALKKFGELLPKKAGVETAEGVSQVLSGDLAEGDIMVVNPGEIIAADGLVVEGMSSLDTSGLTGQAAPRTVAEGSTVLSGCVNLTNMLKIQVLRPAEDSAAERLVEMIGIAHANRSSREKFMARFAAVLPPVAAAAGVLIAVLPPLFQGGWLEWLRRGILFLLLASPCGLLASVPVTYFGTIASAARLGVFIKGTRFVEILAKARTVVFEKTGVLTEKDYRVAEVVPAGGDKAQLVHLAALAEANSRHPIAQAIREADGNPSAESIQVDEQPCKGVTAFTEGLHVCVGNAVLMQEHGISCPVPRRKGVAIHVAADNRYLGHFILINKVRDGAFDALESMRQRGIKSLVMLTGDMHSVARQVASSLSFDMVKTELTPGGKMAAVEYLMAAKGDNASLVFVGSGRNDAALFERADAGLVLGALDAPQAIGEADLIMMGENIQTVAELMRLSKKTDLAAMLSILVTAGVRLGGLLLGMFGLVPLLAAVALQAAAVIFSAVNALRALHGFPAGKTEDV